jgi:hypothetical protein
VVSSRCHKLVVDNFVKAFNAVLEAELVEEFTEYNGIYAVRPQRGDNTHPSTHSWGIAIDMGASTHPQGSATATWPQGILDIMKAAGFFWGGDFSTPGRRDPMHWQLATGY